MEYSIFWFRNDLRISDNPGLSKAIQDFKCIPIYILDDKECGEFCLGSASRWWLHNSLHKLNMSLSEKLNIYRGDSEDIILNLIKNYDVKAVYWNRAYEPWRIKRDSDIKSKIRNMGLQCNSFDAVTLWNPWEILKNDGSYYKVFTPFYKKGCLTAKNPRNPIAKPQKFTLIKDKNTLNIDELNLIPKKNWHLKLSQHWKIGEEAASQKLQDFISNGLAGYKNGRNFPIRNNVSRLSPHLHFGEISPHQVWHAIQNLEERGIDVPSEDKEHFLSELGWREFSYYLLYHFPKLGQVNFQKKFDKFPWKNDVKLLKAWQNGKTGYPIVDAGMRELWETGYMHNRIRMIVGSFLVKNLLLHWNHGERWFWDCLVDADLANNSASWQWIAGSGADAAPYFRIFNPVTQGEKFDPEGEYTRKFVPEISNLPNKYLFKPWEAPQKILDDAGITLGLEYPKPIVNLSISRELALETFKQISN